MPKWTKITVAKHITVGGLGATVVGTPAHVADEFERWVREADVDGFNLVRQTSICNPGPEHPIIVLSVFKFRRADNVCRPTHSTRARSRTLSSCSCPSCGLGVYSGRIMLCPVEHIGRTFTKLQVRLGCVLTTQQPDIAGLPSRVCSRDPIPSRSSRAMAWCVMSGCWCTTVRLAVSSIASHSFTD